MFSNSFKKINTIETRLFSFSNTTHNFGKIQNNFFHKTIETVRIPEITTQFTVNL